MYFKPKLHFDNYVKVYVPHIYVYGLSDSPPKISKEIPKDC